jgi:hypothetical protein
MVGDISGDGQPDIILGSTNGTLYGIDRAGDALPYFPMPPSGSSRPISASVALGYLDGDGDMEIVVPIKATGDNLVVIDYKSQASLSNLQWPVFGHDRFRSHNFEMAIVSVTENPDLPVSFALGQNYPNPFNASTSISFTLGHPGEATLAIFDLLGRRIRVLHSGPVSAGQHAFIWDGADESNHLVTSGVYFYKLDSDEGAQTRRMVLLK